MSDPTTPTATTGLAFIGGYLFGDGGGQASGGVLTVTKKSVIAFAQKSPASGKNVLCLRFEAAAKALGGKTVKWDKKGGKDRVQVTGLSFTLTYDAVPAFMVEATDVQARAFLAALIEVEGSKDGKIIDDPSLDHVLAAQSICADAGLATIVKQGDAINSLWIMDDLQVPKLAAFPFVQMARVPVNADGAPVPPPPPPLKEIPLGILSRNGRPEPAGAATVVHVSMADLCPTHDPESFNPNVLSAAISAAKATGAACITLSIDAGVNESQEVKDWFGYVHLLDPQAGSVPNPSPPHDTVRFWLPTYQGRIAAVLAKVADIVEPDPFVRQVMMFWNGAQFSAEWSLREMALLANRVAYQAAGYDADLDLSNCKDAARMFRAAGFLTTKMCTFTPMYFQHLQPDLTMKQDRQATLDVWAAWLDEMGAQLVLGIDNADLTSYGPNRPPIYADRLDFATAHDLDCYDQTVITAKFPGQTAGCQQFWAIPNLTLAKADRVRSIEISRGSGLTIAQEATAQAFLLS